VWANCNTNRKLGLLTRVGLWGIEKVVILFFKFLFTYYCCTRGTLWHLQRYLKYYLNSPRHQSPLLPTPILRIVSTGHMVPFSHEYTIFLPYSLSFTFSLCPPLLLVPTPYIGPVLPSCPSFLKKRHLCLFKMAIQGVSIWHFHEYLYYILNWFIPSIFFLSILVPIFFPHLSFYGELNRFKYSILILE
jgi:hypothetical protein